jgi:hypothetical protein
MTYGYENPTFQVVCSARSNQDKAETKKAKVLRCDFGVVNNFYTFVLRILIFFAYGVKA